MGYICPEKKQVSVREVKGHDLEQVQESFGEVVTSKLRTKEVGILLQRKMRATKTCISSFLCLGQNAQGNLLPG